MVSLEKQLEELRDHLIECISIDFGPLWVTDEIFNWPDISWTAFQKELLDQEINLTTSLNRCWQNFFMVEKEKFHLLKFFLDHKKLNGFTVDSSMISNN